MTTQPEYLKQQAECKARNRQFAIDLATKRLAEAEREFRYEMMKIERDYNAFEDPDFVYTSTRKSDANQITADPTVAQYA